MQEVKDQGDNGGSDQKGSNNDQQQQKICDPINGNPYAKECGGEATIHPGPGGATVHCKPQKVYPGLGGSGP